MCTCRCVNDDDKPSAPGIPQPVHRGFPHLWTNYNPVILSPLFYPRPPAKATILSGGRSRHLLPPGAVRATEARLLPPGAVRATEAPWHPRGVSPPRALSPRLADPSRRDHSLRGPFAPRRRLGNRDRSRPLGPCHHPAWLLTAREICGAGRGASATDPARSEKGLKRGPQNRRSRGPSSSGPPATDPARSKKCLKRGPQNRRSRGPSSNAVRATQTPWHPVGISPLGPYHHPPLPLQGSASVTKALRSPPRWQKIDRATEGVRGSGAKTVITPPAQPQAGRGARQGDGSGPRDKMLEAKPP